MRIFLIVFVSIVAFCIVFLLTISLIVAKLTVFPKLRTHEYEKTLKNMTGTEKLEAKDTQFVLHDGYIIHGKFIPKENSNKYILILHGHTSNYESSLRHALLYHELGLNCVVIDLRGHGFNKKVAVTMGYRESQDVSEIINELYKQFGDEISLGLAGVSLGASTCLLTLKLTQNLKFVISDCGFCSLKDQMKNTIKLKHIPWFLVAPFLNMWFFILGKFSYKKSSPINYLGDNRVPILLVHGSKDEFVPYNNMDRIYNILNCRKQKLTINGAVHANSIDVDKQCYKDCVKQFLKNVDK